MITVHIELYYPVGTHDHIGVKVLTSSGQKPQWLSTRESKPLGCPLPHGTFQAGEE